MIILKILGWIWTLPHTLFGVLLLLTVYFPKSIRWSEGALDVVVRWHVIPEGFDRTGDGDIDDPEDFRTGAQTHGFIIFYRDKHQRDRGDLREHERVHVLQCMILGGVLYPLLYGLSFAINLARGQGTVVAYKNIWFERQAYRIQREFKERTQLL